VSCEMIELGVTFIYIEEELPKIFVATSRLKTLLILLAELISPKFR